MGKSTVLMVVSAHMGRCTRGSNRWFFDDLNPGGTSGTVKAIFYGSAGVAAMTLVWSVLDAVSVAKNSGVRPPKYGATIIPLLDSQNKGALMTAQIRF